MDRINDHVINLIVVGVGGQGNVLASKVVAVAGIRAGLHVSVGETFGVSQRGGSVMSHVRLSRRKQYGPLIPRGEASIIIGFEPLETLRVFREYGNSASKVIVNMRPSYPVGVLRGDEQYPPLEAIERILKASCLTLHVIAATELAFSIGNPVSMNIVMTGALAGLGWIPVPPVNFIQAMEGLFAEQVLELNTGAFQLGLKAIQAGEGNIS